MKGKIALLLVLVLLMQALSLPTFAAVPSDDIVAQPFYIGLGSKHAELTLENASSGYLKCKGTASLRPGYTADMFMDLYSIDDEGTQVPVATWFVTDTSAPALIKYRYVEDGYTYLLNVIVTVYDSEGNFVERATSIDTLYY